MAWVRNDVIFKYNKKLKKIKIIDMRFENVNYAIQYAILKYVVNEVNGDNKENFVLENIIKYYFDFDRVDRVTCSQVDGIMDGDKVTVNFDVVCS